MQIKERIKLIDDAIDNILTNLNNGIEIKSYQIDNIRVEKRSAFDLITELRKMRSFLAADMNKKTGITYVFGGRV